MKAAATISADIYLSVFTKSVCCIRIGAVSEYLDMLITFGDIIPRNVINTYFSELLCVSFVLCRSSYLPPDRYDITTKVFLH